jgi:N-acetylmuramoyl-L-alanine amidase
MSGPPRDRLPRTPSSRSLGSTGPARSRRSSAGRVGSRRRRGPQQITRNRRAAVFVIGLVILGCAALVFRGLAGDHVLLPPDVVLHADALKGVTVVIDPGHGGEDPGTVQQGVTEASLTYRMAATLRAVVEQYGGRAVFTMTSSALANISSPTSSSPLLNPTDAEAVTRPGAIAKAGATSTVDLYARADAGAKQWNAHGPKVVFISLHYDSSPTPSSRGGLVLIGLRTTTIPALATNMAEEMGKAKLGGDIKRQQLGVLGAVHNPIPNRVLVELGTISNTTDRRAAQNPQWRWRVARILTAAIAKTKLG